MSKDTPEHIELDHLLEDVPGLQLKRISETKWVNPRLIAGVDWQKEVPDLSQEEVTFYMAGDEIPFIVKGKSLQVVLGYLTDNTLTDWAPDKPEPGWSTCTHCGEHVVERSPGNWSHEHNRSRCQKPGVTYGHLAHPEEVPCWADGPNPCLGAQQA